MRISVYCVLSLLATCCTSVFCDTPLTEHKKWLEVEKHRDTQVDYPKSKLPRYAAEARALTDPQESLLAKIIAARTAVHTLDFGTYIMKRDLVGYLLLYEIKNAIKRGVSVRGLVDSVGSFHLTHAELKSLLAVTPGEMLNENQLPSGKKAYVEIRIFNSIFHWERRLRRISKRLTDPLHDGIDSSMLGPSLNRRMHDKVWLKDINYPSLAEGIVGGRNLSNDYYGSPMVTPKTYNDADMLFRNDRSRFNHNTNLATTIGNHFNTLFYRQRNKVLKPNIFHATDKRHWKKMDAAASLIYGAVSSDGTTFSARLNRMLAGHGSKAEFYKVEMEFLSEIQNINREHKVWETLNYILPQDEDNKALQEIDNPNSIILNVKKRMASAKTSIDIVSPYFYLTRSTKKFWVKRLFQTNTKAEPITKGDIQLFIGWLKANPDRKLRILTNSLLTTDNLPAQGMVDLDVAPRMIRLAKNSGVLHQLEFRELGTLEARKLGGSVSFGKLHAKFAIIDRTVTLVTTSNADPRSRKINSEVGFLVHGAEFSNQFITYFEYLAQRSYRVNTPEWIKMTSHRKLRIKKLLSKVMYKSSKWLRAKWLL